MSVIFDPPPMCQKKMNLDLGFDFSVDYLDRSGVLVYDDEILVVLICPAHHVVHYPVHQVLHVLLPFSSAISPPGLL